MSGCAQAVSYEERCVEVTNYLIQNLGAKELEIIRYNEEDQKLSNHIKIHLQQIEAKCREAKVHYKIINSNVVDDQLATKLSSSVKTLDVSCFTKYHVLSLLKTGRFKKVVYAPALVHNPPMQVIHQLKAVQVPGYSGLRVANRDDFLFILAGFEGYRALNIYKLLAPRVCVLCIGVPWFEPASLVKYVSTAMEQNIMTVASTNVRIETVPSTDAHAFAARFVSLVKTYVQRHESKPNIVTVPLGTKVQAVGLYLAHKNLPEMQVIYPVPERYEQISRGFGKIVEINLDRDEVSQQLDTSIDRQ